jgi:hypothetical protein
LEQSVIYFENSLEIIKNARRHAGVTRDNQTLSKCEFARARSWLKAIFEEKFMRNQGIKDQIKKRTAEPDSCSRKEKKSEQDRRRGAFKTWQKDLFGNTPLLNAFLQEGMFDYKDIKLFLALFLSKDTTPEIIDGQHLADNNDVVAVAGAAALTPNPATLRLEAKQARATLRTARFYATRLTHCLTSAQNKLVDRLEQDELLNMCIRKNQAYGHGIGTTKPTTQHDAILHRMCCQAMDNYWTVEPKAPTSCGEHPTDPKRTDTPAHEH